jgi:hypothetical protein
VAGCILQQVAKNLRQIRAIERKHDAIRDAHFEAYPSA